MMMMIVYDDDFLREQVVASQEPSHMVVSVTKVGRHLAASASKPFY